MRILEVPYQDRAIGVLSEQRRRRLWLIVHAGRPMTVRQVFYQASVRGYVEKSEAGYTKVQTDLVQMRRSGALPLPAPSNVPRCGL